MDADGHALSAGRVMGLREGVPGNVPLFPLVLQFSFFFLFLLTIPFVPAYQPLFSPPQLLLRMTGNGPCSKFVCQG